MTGTDQSHHSTEQLFLEHLPVIDRILAVIVRRHALEPADADEFTAWARARLMDGDYAILRKFAGRSSLKTYLTVVCANLFRDHRNSVWGKWRPSAAAKRLGPIGIRLEELVIRDGCPPREAIETVILAGASETRSELARIAALLPHRTRDKHVSIDDVAHHLSDSSSNDPRVAEERTRVTAAIQSAIEQLSVEDRLITRMRFWDGISVADIAKALRVEQKPLYRRIERIQQQLGNLLTREGITEPLAREFLSEVGQW